MKIFKKVIAGVAALAIAVGGISFGAASLKEAKADTTKAAVVDGKVVDIIGAEIATLGTNLGSVAWNDDGGGMVKLENLSGYAEYAGKALLEVEYTTDAGGQFYVAATNDWSKNAVWHNESGTVYSYFTDDMATNGIMLNGQDCNITSVKLVTCTVYDEIAVIATDLGSINWEGAVKVESSVFQAYGIQVGDACLKVDWTVTDTKNNGSNIYLTDTSDWNTQPTWYGGNVTSEVFNVTDAIISNGCMINGSGADIDKVTLYGISASSVGFEEDQIEIVKSTEGFDKDTVTLNAVIVPENATCKKITWSTSDKTVANVDENGKVTAVGAGTATITVKTVDGGKTAVCEVTVTLPEPKTITVMLDGKEIPETGIEMTAGATKSLTAAVGPAEADQTVTYETGDKNVVTIDADGKITAVAAGTATITAKAGKVTKEITVTVTKADDGSITVEAEGEFAPSIEMSKKEVVTAISKVLTEEQLAAVEAGTAVVDIKLAVANIDATVKDADKNLIAEAIKNIPDSEKLNFKVLDYLDITLGAEIDGTSIAVTETDGLMTVSVAVEKPVKGTYKVVRIHDGKTDVIDSTLSEDGTRLTFKTDKFSTYAIIFSDVATGDSANAALIILLGMACAAFIAAVAVKKTAKQ